MQNKEITEADKRFEELGYSKCTEDGTCALYSYSSEDKDYEVLFEKQKEEIVLSNYHDEDAEITRFELSFPELYPLPARRLPPLRWGMNCVPRFLQTT